MGVVNCSGKESSYGLCRGKRLTARDALLSLSVLLFAALNIAFGGAWPGAAEAVYLLFAVFGEEVLFRGVLPAVWGEKLGAAGAAAASAALFALLHLGSAIGGSVSAAAVQALCAFGAGLLLTAVRMKTGSIALPLLAPLGQRFITANQRLQDHLITSQSVRSITPFSSLARKNIG